ncbi:MAG: hypothetical protein R2746_08780 [Acidimicrobiales bacterium]
MDDEESGEVVHHFWLSERQGRAQLAAEIIERVGPTVVFSRTRHGADRIAKQLGQAGVSAAAIHGNRSQAQRERPGCLPPWRGQGAGGHRRGGSRHPRGGRGVRHPLRHPGRPQGLRAPVGPHRSGRQPRHGRGPGARGPEAQAAKLRKAAGIDGSLVEPDVSALPEGHAAFRRRPLDVVDGKVGRQARVRQAEGRRAARSRVARLQEGRQAEAGRRPVPHRPARASRPRRPLERRRSLEGGGPQRARRARRGRVHRARGGRPVLAVVHPGVGHRWRRARPQPGRAPSRGLRRRRAGRSRCRQGEAGRLRGAGSGGSARALAGSVAEESAPAASRRKAKREALEAAGIPATGTKKRRSGKPRPPASKRRG